MFHIQRDTGGYQRFSLFLNDRSIKQLRIITMLWFDLSLWVYDSISNIIAIANILKASTFIPVLFRLNCRTNPNSGA